MKIIFSEVARNQIRKLPPLVKKEIKPYIVSLSEFPYTGKTLQMDLIGLRSLAFKRYRVVYEINEDKNTLMILSVAHRKEVYDELTSKIKSLKTRN